MSSAEFVRVLTEVGYPRASKFNPSDWDWMFEVSIISLQLLLPVFMHYLFFTSRAALMLNMSHHRVLDRVG